MRLSTAPAPLAWAIIPAAGSGTRLRPASRAVPKVLLPVGVRPMIDWAVEEAVRAGVGNIAAVVSPAQPAVRAHLENLVSDGDIPGQVALHIVEQPLPGGIGDALMRCRSLTGEHAFGVVVPDNWFDAQAPPLAQVAASRAASGLDAIGLVRVGPAEARLLGNVGRVELEPLGGSDFRVVRLADKQRGTFSVEGSRPALRGCARYALGPHFYDALEAVRPDAGVEWDDVPAFQRLVAGAGLAGRLLAARHFDVGQPAGYLAAMRYLFERDVSGNGA